MMMAPPSVQSGPLCTQNDVREIMTGIGVLLEVNKDLDKKVNFLMMKKTENSKKIAGFVGTVKKMGGNFKEVLVSLKEQENYHVQRIEESTRNLRDQEKLLQDLEVEGGQDQNWVQQFENLVKYRETHKKYKDFKEKQLKAIRHEWRIGHEIESQLGAGTSRGSCVVKKKLKEKFLTKEIGPSSSKSITSKRKLDESVVDCGLKPKKISPTEKEAIIQTVLKVEQDSPPKLYTCNICHHSFTCAASLVIHHENHYAQAQEKFDCPFSNCSFSGNEENLTKHVRAKHTKEQLFSCSSCPIKFHTMTAKVAHQKKHSQPTIWAQCGKATCLKFYHVANGSCRCGNK
eukprot:GFUD01019234.1.p1 GENE.GFUD01019234.1~~GFUD01019234.1.p1  ORF type:complete len:344 (-),score=100.38 GFUD01019234.1:108-1139(-)